MASPAQIVANRANAQSSTGPRSEASKTRVGQNATRHGLTARHLVIRDDEREEFEAFQQSLFTELDPQGAVEIITFRELLHAAWNLERFRRLEVELSGSGDAAAFSEDRNSAALDRLARYQCRSQRAYYSALRELRTLQTTRALRAVKLDEQTAAEVPAITDINELTKQTQSEVTARAMEIAIKMTDWEAKSYMRQVRQHRAAQTLHDTAPSAPPDARSQS
jgi:hypothetical protein